MRSGKSPAEGAGALPGQVSVPVLRSFFCGGFECSTHVLRSGRRLDLVASTRHDRFVEQDYARLAAFSIRTVREGLRWHLIEPQAYRYDFSTVLPILRAAQAAGVQVIWDLMHFGWPDGLDPFSAALETRLAGLARAFATLHRDETGHAPLVCPINEVSFLSWCGAEVGEVNPFAEHRGYELKRALARAAIAATRAVREVDTRARFFQIEPVFHVEPEHPSQREAAERYRAYQFQVWDMLAGRECPELGGHESILDVVGVNYYPWNQWFYGDERHAGAELPLGHPRRRPFPAMLAELHRRYERPIFIGETGCEGDARAGWLAHIGEAVHAALQAGVPVEGVCLYPIVDFPGWENDRHCENGLWGYADETGRRAIHEPMAHELRRQVERFKGSTR